MALLLIGTMSSILFSGLKSFEDYRKSADPKLPLNLDTLHFFTKEALHRRYLKLTTKRLPEKTTLASFHIYTDEKDLSSLESNLPSSAKTRFIAGHIKVDAPEFSNEIQFRYRGGLPLHWLYKKKSLRVKLPPFTSYRGEKSFNLVNPSTIHTVTDWISYDMARSLGLLTPQYFPARVYINDRYNGLHYFLSQIDESFLRNNNRMPGSIYSGDTIYFPNPFGVDKEGTRESSFKTDEGTSLIWEDERLWSKKASRNAESANDRSDIKKYISVMNEKNPKKFMQDFRNYFDVQKYYTFWGLDTLLGSYHHDNFHNHKIYFDPYKGKFEPIEWDIRFWSSIFLTKDLPVNSLLRQIILNPVLEYERDLTTYSLLKRYSVEKISSQVDATNKIIRPEIEADPLRQHPDSRYGRFEIDKEVPFSLMEYDNAVEELKMVYKSRHEFLQNIFEDVHVSYVLTPSDIGTLLTFSITGNSPVKIEPWSLIPASMQSEVQLERKYGSQLSDITPGKVDILYPGRSAIKGNAIGRADNWALLAFGREIYVSAPLHYQYLIKGKESEDLEMLNSNVTNAITGTSVNLQQVNELEDANNTTSVHPWSLTAITDSVVEEITLSGEIYIKEDQIFSEKTLVRIQPGTIFKLAKGRSLVFYGKVLIEGTENRPVTFEQSTEGEPWGSIVIQGKAASGSRLVHVRVNGGSLTTQRLINYPGQLNIHDVESFELKDCVIEQNHIGDDALHISYSRGSIDSCTLNNTAFDAIDMDIADIDITNVQFNNIGNDALDLMTSNVNIMNAIINDAGDKCFSIGERSKIRIQQSQLYNCSIGVAVKDESLANIENIKFKGYRESAIALYQKNPRYNSGGTITGRQLYGLTMQDIQSDKTSSNHIEPSEVHSLNVNSSAIEITTESSLNNESQ